MNQEFEKYIELYKQYQTTTYAYKKGIPKLHHILTDISDEELLKLQNEIINPIFVKNKLLILDLENHIPESNEMITKDEFIIYVQQLFNYYNNILIEYMEDNVWTIYDKTSKKYPLKDNELIFENSISYISESLHDDVSEYYINMIVAHLNKLSTKIHVSSKFIQSPANEMCWVILKCKSDVFI